MSGNDITGVSRGEGGTTATTHIKGALVEMNLTAEDLAEALSVPEDIETRFNETLADFVASGLLWTDDTGLNADMSAGVAYINGIRLAVSAVSNRAFTASKDTYVDLGDNGVLDYNEVANGAASPALAASHIRIAKVITNGTDTTSVVTSGLDSLGNSIRSTSPVRANSIDWVSTGVGAGIWWEELGRTTLVAAGDTISVTPIAARKYLRVIAVAVETGAVAGTLRFNNDSGNNYAYRASYSGGAEATAASASGLAIFNESNAVALMSCDVVNISASEKPVSIIFGSTGTAGAAALPVRGEYLGKWVNTSAQITRVDLINGGAGDFAIGSELIVLGHN